MRLKLNFAFQLFLIVLIETTLGKNTNKTKLINDGNDKLNLKDKSDIDRSKRSLDESDIPFWPQRGRRLRGVGNDNSRSNNLLNEDPPFWGTRGRRDSSSMEDYVDYGAAPRIYYAINCKNCRESNFKDFNDNNGHFKDRRQEQEIPFWGNRGRRNSDEIDESDSPFWGNRGRRQDEPPFWGTRGRRQEDVPFWGNRGRRYEADPYWENKDKSETRTGKKESLKNVLQDAINSVEDKIEHLARNRRGGTSYASGSFWDNRGRNSKLSDLFKLGHQRFKTRRVIESPQPSESSTLLDDRVFAEQPHFILVERSSRSSMEDDPFFISRGKKKFFNSHFTEGNRNRRGAIEELVKSVRNDPYYIARGKKDSRDTNSSKELGKAKDLICATIDLIVYKNKGNKAKREVDDNDRDRRTILKKLAAQLQMDPYFVSRGKKNESSPNDDNLVEFIKEVSVQCD